MMPATVGIIEMPLDSDPLPNRSRPGHDARMRACLDLLVARYPHIEKAAFLRYERNPTFQELCEEYQACAEAAERLSRPPRNEPMRAEYAALQLRLEGELLRFMAEAGAPTNIDREHT